MHFPLDFIMLNLQLDIKQFLKAASPDVTAEAWW